MRITSVSTVLANRLVTDIFFIKKKLSKLQGFIRGEWNWLVFCLNDSEIHERLRKFKAEKNLRRLVVPLTPLETWAFGARLGNWSVFILYPHLHERRWPGTT